jgi:23S rRNA (adenine2030-N6)-methyltransferase
VLSYRHAFHAGNAADVLKHSILCFCLNHFAHKEKPFLCVDTHAGAGSYDLNTGFAVQNKEWADGIQRLAELTAVPPLLSVYQGIVSTAARYPGSPALMAQALRNQDRLVCFELHPADYAILQTELGARAEVRQEDGFDGLRSLLPPPSRRACVLIDPSYEIKSDFQRVPAAITDALKRFSSGLYLVWYPLLQKMPETEDFPAVLCSLYQGNRCIVELRTGQKGDPCSKGMYGSGMVMFNPPWTLHQAARESLPILAHLLGEKSAWQVRHLPK